MKTCKQYILLAFSFCLMTCHRQINHIDYAEINVEKAGTLGNLLGQTFGRMDTLILSGKLNSRDFRILASMEDLIYLDMQKASISDVELADLKFKNCSHLRTVKLPEIIFMGMYAFMDCPDLDTLTVSSDLLWEKHACDLTDKVYKIKKEYSDLDSCDLLITKALNHYLKNTQWKLPIPPIERYKYLMDLIDNHLILQGYTQSKMNESGSMRTLWQEYIYHHYSILAKQLASELEPLIRQSQEAFLKFAGAEMVYLHNIQDDLGSASPLAYSELNEALFRVGQQNVSDFYFALKIDTYTLENNYLPLPEKYFTEEYKTLLLNLPTDSEYWEIMQKKREDAVYALHNMETAWNDLMRVRNAIFGQLPQNVKNIYKNSTYRLQKFHFTQLKNAFQGYGMTNSSLNSCLLPDSCSYEELLTAPNFTYKLSVLNYEPKKINAIDNDKYIVHE